MLIKILLLLRACESIRNYNKSMCCFTTTIVIVEMYAELALVKLFIREGDIELPEEVKEDKELNRKKKNLVTELQVC